MNDSWSEQALRRFPAGSNGEFGVPAEELVVPARGEGAWVWDEMGRKFLDMSMAWGSTFVGHSHPRVVEAVREAVGNGINFASINPKSIELVERLCALSPCMERARLVTSGTEATMMCLRVARGATGRRKILRFEGAYHGQHPIGVAGMLGISEAGAPKIHPHGSGAPWVSDDVVVAPFNDLERTREIIEDYHHELAGVIVEPVHRCLAPEDGFLQGLRAVTSANDVPLIFDEVVTGFRLALSGAQEYFGVIPDLVAYGKALGGGMPIAAYGGKAELMDVVSEWRIQDDDYVWSASTTGGGPVTSSAALAVLDILSEAGIHQRAAESGAGLRALMATALAELGIEGCILGIGPLAQIGFSKTQIRNQKDHLASDRARGGRFMRALVRNGVFVNPMGTKLYLSIQHGDSELSYLEDALKRALGEV